MKVAIGLGSAYSGKKRDFDNVVSFAVEAEKLGVAQGWTAEAWGYDAVLQCFEAHGEEPVEEILAALLALGREWSGNDACTDDITLVAVRHAREPASGESVPGESTQEEDS